MFGVGSTIDSTRIETVVQLEPWDPSAEYERVGLDQKMKQILDVGVPLLRIPVRPGRNLAVIIEVAALNQRLKLQGYSSAEMFNRALLARTTARRRRVK